MRGRYALLILALLILSLFITGCQGGVTGTSVGGADIEMGLDVDDDLNIVSPQTTFSAGEVFYVAFDNNASFEAEQILMVIEESGSENVVLEEPLEVDPMWDMLAIDVMLPDPARYKISFIVEDTVRATQEVIVE